MRRDTERYAVRPDATRMSVTMCITKFGTNLNKDLKYLKTVDITISNADKLHFYIKQMINSGPFERRNIIDWENKIDTHKTWA